jgi:dTDP-4-dehydrorhamnose 3,5-epimerase-like enzyme
MSNACRLITLPTRKDDRGALAIVEIGYQIPFTVRREFHLFELRSGVHRGGHAHKSCHQFLVAMVGEFCITTDDGSGVRCWELADPSQGLHVPPGHWVELNPRSDGAVLSVLASHGYDEFDYLRDREAFIHHVHSS